MNKYLVFENQSLFDIAIVLTGNPLNAFWIAKDNGLVMSEKVPAGVELIIHEGLNNNKSIQKYYKINNLIPATSLSEQNTDIINGCEGIECWGIETNFIAS